MGARRGPYSHDGQGAAQVWCILQHALALVQRLKHQLELAIVQVEHRLFQVADASVHQLCALGGGPRGKVLPLHQRCAQAPGQKNKWPG